LVIDKDCSVKRILLVQMYIFLLYKKEAVPFWNGLSFVKQFILPGQSTL
jgi:hypothetical protein